jgi:DNA replication and repair protein RecF
VLTEARAEAVSRLGDRAAHEFRGLSAGSREALVVRYEPAVEGDPRDEAFRVRLAQRRGDELVRRTTLVGPHRDDLSLSVEGLAARGFASHGEAWGGAIALRLALAHAVAMEMKEPPVLLLDDPFSGLDPERRRRLAGDLDQRGQVVITVPDEDHIPPGASVWTVGEAVVARA